MIPRYAMNKKASTIVLVGHPYAPIGMGQHIRCTFRALRSVGVRPSLLDVFGLVMPETDQQLEFAKYSSESLGGINIFHINGDEVEQTLAHLSHKQAWNGYNIIYPLWELSRYPEIWARQLDRFEEIWAPSKFVHDSLAAVCSKPVVHMPMACEVLLSSFLGRRYFGIPETDYAFLFFYDLRSYTTRKNPQGVIEAFRRFLSKKPFAKASLVIKINGGDLNSAVVEQLRQELESIAGHMVLINRVMTDNEVKNLVRCCDCFVSLHRSEGYGLGIAEAMVLGKPVIATTYSGNMDFMDVNTAFPVNYRLIPLSEGEYPHWQEQKWADPDLDQAAYFMTLLVDDPNLGTEIGRCANARMRKHFGYRSSGLRYRARLETIDGKSNSAEVADKPESE